MWQNKKREEFPGTLSGGDKTIKRKKGGLLPTAECFESLLPNVQPNKS